MRSIWVGPAVAVIATLSLTACGESASGTTSSVLDLTSTNYVVQSTTPLTVGTTDPTATVLAGEQIYVVVAGDYPTKVAEMHGVTLDALNLANAATPDYDVFYVGLSIKIPAGGVVPVVTTTIPGQTPANTTTTVPGVIDNCGKGSYVIEAGDYPGKVATKFDITVEQLDAANADTKDYDSFIVGITIVIPEC